MEKLSLLSETEFLAYVIDPKPDDLTKLGSDAMWVLCLNYD